MTTTTTAMPELSRKRIDNGGVTYWGVYTATHAIQIEYVPAFGRMTGVFTCTIAAEGAAGALDNCEWVGRCTADSYGIKAADIVRERFNALGATPADDAVYALLAELHATDWPVAS